MEIDWCPQRAKRLNLGMEKCEIRAVLGFASGQLCSTCPPSPGRFPATCTLAQGTADQPCVVYLQRAPLAISEIEALF